MLQLINWQLAKHPLNWVIILLMVLLAGIALHLVLDFYNMNPGTPSGVSSVQTSNTVASNPAQNA
jgi:hypothetical protein